MTHAVTWHTLLNAKIRMHYGEGAVGPNID